MRREEFERQVIEADLALGGGCNSNDKKPKKGKKQSMTLKVRRSTRLFRNNTTKSSSSSPNEGSGGSFFVDAEFTVKNNSRRSRLFLNYNNQETP